MADRDDATAAAIVTAYLNDPTRRVEHEIAEALRAARAEGEAAGRAAGLREAISLIENMGFISGDAEDWRGDALELLHRALAPSPDAAGNRGGEDG